MAIVLGVLLAICLLGGFGTTGPLAEIIQNINDLFGNIINLNI